MSLVARLRRARQPLRRVSPERARPGAPRPRRPAVSQPSEKLAVAAVAGALALVLAGAGALDGARQWCAGIVFGTLALAGAARYLADFRREALASVARVIGLAVALLSPLAAAVAWESLAGPADARWLPLSFVGFVLALVFGRALAVEGTFVAAALLVARFALQGRLDAALGGLAVSVGGGLAAALASEAVKRRSALVRAGLVVGAVQASLAASVALLDPAFVPTAAQLVDLGLIALAGVAAALLVSGLLPAIESLCDVVTDVSLLELGNPHAAPLLRRLLLEAPGTFHHSYLAGLVAEAAAEAIGANALLARVGALYHDVGKLDRPEYFAETSVGAHERHAALAPEMSLLVLAAHTRDGVELGRYYGLPRPIVEFMAEHHGTTCIEHFPRRAVELRGEVGASEASDPTRTTRFRYAGPKPRSRESAIVMIADAVEAAARRLPEPDPARLKEMVHEVAMARTSDGQLSECALTFAELAAIEDACVRVLAAIHRSRPSQGPGELLAPAPRRERVRRRLAAAGEQRAASAARDRTPVAGGPWASA